MGYYRCYEMFGYTFCIAQQDEAIVLIELADATLAGNLARLGERFEEQETNLIRKVAKELEEYFDGSRETFDLPLTFKGTEFQKKVWQALQEIPYGQTATYGQIAERIGNPKGSRAVGMACNRNHILIMVPCHRVIGANGKLVGFGCGLDMKERLLNREAERKEANV